MRDVSPFGYLRPDLARKWRSGAQLKILPLTNEVMFRAGELHEYHKDPADRMIIASALVGGFTVVTADRNFPLYGVQTII